MEAETAVPLRQQHQEQLQRHRKVRHPAGSRNTASGDLGDPQTFKFALTVASTLLIPSRRRISRRSWKIRAAGNMKIELYYDGSLGGDND